MMKSAVLDFFSASQSCLFVTKPYRPIQDMNVWGLIGWMVHETKFLPENGDKVLFPAALLNVAYVTVYINVEENYVKTVSHSPTHRFEMMLENQPSVMALVDYLTDWLIISSREYPMSYIYVSIEKDLPGTTEGCQGCAQAAALKMLGLNDTQNNCRAFTVAHPAKLMNPITKDIKELNHCNHVEGK